MKLRINTILFLILISCWNCNAQKKNAKSLPKSQLGTLVYYMHEAYFFPTLDTAWESFDTSKIIGLKLDNFRLNEIYDSISHKRPITLYVDAGKNKIDTVKANVGILKINLKIRKLESALSPDTALFNFEVKPNQWVLMRYVIRPDVVVDSVTPILKKDKKAYKEAYGRL